ncbi:MAG: carbohydrate-binding protein [Rhodocyclaceae bacterium]
MPNTNTDWMVSSNQLAQDIRPRDCAVVEQTPPDFRWPDVITSGGYAVNLTYPDGFTKVLPATQNWRNWDEVLPAGTYSWTVSYAGGTTSMPRRFIVNANSKPFLVPSMSTVLSRVTAKPHPRSLPDATTFALIKSQRAAGISTLLNAASGQFNQAVPSQGSGSSDARKYSDLALQALLACVFSNQDSYCNEAVRRVMNLASWDPRGATWYLTSTGRVNYANDMTARLLTWTVATGYDWLYPRLSSAQRSQVLGMLLIRNGDMYKDLIGARSRIAREPRDSHANQTLSVVAVISTLLAGDLSEANGWLTNSLPLALNAISPWGGEEGGFANAATQGNWDLGENSRVWNQLRYATGIDVAQKPWVRNWGRYFTYFTPPGMAGGATEFGDGFEDNQTYDQALYGTAYTYFSPSPLGRWHASLLRVQNMTRMEYLLAPPADFSGTQPFPAGMPNALNLYSIGQVAMHSDLSNLARTSVYFKSSPPPYGAYNHSHADQNSFVVNAGGQRLAIESGYYAGYESDYWYNWYHTTKAKNAITYDGGLGQLFYEKDGKMGYGRVTSFSSSATHDIVTGDATAAYGGALSKAQRSMVYLRPNLILVYDNLASATGRQWEWNIHALNQMSVISDRQISIQSGTQKLCVTMLAGPTMRFTQTNQFSVSPGSSYPLQWHGNFYSTTRLPATEFIALLNVGCTATTASASKANGIWTIPVGDKTVTIGATGAVSLAGVAPAPAPTPVPTPPPASAPLPYTGTPIPVPGSFEAENFDKGGEGIAYHDNVKGNAGGVYRIGEDVDLIASDDTLGGGYVVNNFEKGEWLAYTINVASTGTYIVGLRSSQSFGTSPVAFHLEIDGVPVTGSLLVPTSGGWSTFQWVEAPSLPLSAGTHVLKVVADQPYFNLNSVRVLADQLAPPPSSTPYTGTPIAVPGTFEAENFDRGGEGLAYHDTVKGNQGGMYRLTEDVDIIASTDSLGGGQVVNNFSTGEWLAYTINVVAGGRYTIGLRASNNFNIAGVAFRVEIDGVPVIASTLVPNTGSWDTFQWVTTPALSLSAGRHVLKIVADKQYFNLNSVRVTTAP